MKIVIEATLEEILAILKNSEQTKPNPSDSNSNLKRYKLERIPYTNHYVYVEDK